MRRAARAGRIAAGTCLALAAAGCSSIAVTPRGPASSRFELLATGALPSDLDFHDTLVGGLSGIYWSPTTNRYHAISDDRSERAPARVYELTIERSSDRPTALEIEVVGVILLRDEGGTSWPRGGIDPEGIAPDDEEGAFWVSSEGSTRAGIAPTVTRYDTSGRATRSLQVPPHYTPAEGRSGVRDNQAFESLTRAPGTPYLFTATEGALVGEGPAADVDVPTPSRLLRFDLVRDGPPVEYRYWADAVARAPALPGAFRTAGLVELLALDPETLLALERSFGVGTGYEIRLYEASLAGASSLPPPDLVDGEPRPVRKRLLLEFSDLGIGPRNLEGMTFGPPLADGRRTLVVVADNNFRKGDHTQILLLAYSP